VPAGLSIFVCSGCAFWIAVTFFWGIGALIWRHRWNCNKNKNNKIKNVSVIVAGRNEEAHVEDCLNSLINQDYLFEYYRIVFVDDHSQDNTLVLARRIADRYPKNLTVLSAPPCPADCGPKKNAIQHGIRSSNGELLLFTDADCVVSCGWIKTLASCFGPDVGAVSGMVLRGSDSTLKSVLQRQERILIGFTTAAAIGYNSPASASGGNFAYRRHIFDDIGGIYRTDVMSGDDDLMVQEIARRGYRVEFASGKDSVVTELRDGNLRQQMNAAIRHQSTLKYYPFHWRFLYAMTILASVFMVVATGMSLYDPALLAICACVIVAKVVLEGYAIFAFQRSLAIKFSFREFAFAEVLLPLYLVIRPLLALFPRFRWNDQEMPHAAIRAK
jgi:poly-beta-1,6-N-acetyl-D-glucosamine synthase